MVLRRRILIFIWVHISSSHTTRVVAKIGCWDYIFDPNQSLIVVNLRGLDKYGSKHTASWTSVQAKTGGTCEKTRMNGKYTRRQQYEEVKI